MEITGFRSVDVEDAEAFVKAAREELPESVWVQFFDAGLVATWQHLYFAVLNALLAFKNKRNISKSVAMETLSPTTTTATSAQRQIRKALDFMGVKCAVADVAVVVVGERAEPVEALVAAVSKRVGKEPDDAVLGVSQEKAERIREAFGITDVEIEAVLEKNDEALVDLVVERVALLSTQL